MSTTNLKLPQVLVIEDDAALRDLIARSLRMRGFHVREAGDGLAGLRLLEAYEPDVLILDLGLPIATGFDVMSELRAAVQPRVTPVIAISGYEEQLAKARERSDFVAVLSKPFDPEELIRKVQRVSVAGPVGS